MNKILTPDMWNVIAFDGLPANMDVDFEGTLTSPLLLILSELGEPALAYYVEEFNDEGDAKESLWMEYGTQAILHEPERYIEIDMEEFI